MHHRQILFSALAVMSAALNKAEEPASKSRLQQVQEEVQQRRKMLENAQGESGMVVAPLAYPESWFAEPRDLKIENTSLVLCGQAFATLARKEVMISGRVVKRKITLITDSVSSERRLEAFRRALESQGIAIVHLGPRILALVDAADAPK
ncbi:MAG: hypothetical protein ABIQ12_12210 [Opitutaceae bacterium]